MFSARRAVLLGNSTASYNVIPASIPSSSRYLSSSTPMSISSSFPVSVKYLLHDKQRPPIKAIPEVVPEGTTGLTHYLVTLLRSTIALPKNIERTCRALGLRHRLHSSIVPISNITAGHILVVKELVAVRTLTKEEAKKAAYPRGEESAKVLGLSKIYRVPKVKCIDEQRGYVKL